MISIKEPSVIALSLLFFIEPSLVSLEDHCCQSRIFNNRDWYKLKEDKRTDYEACDDPCVYFKVDDENPGTEYCFGYTNNSLYFDSSPATCSVQEVESGPLNLTLSLEYIEEETNVLTNLSADLEDLKAIIETNYMRISSRKRKHFERDNEDSCLEYINNTKQMLDILLFDYRKNIFQCLLCEAQDIQCQLHESEVRDFIKFLNEKIYESRNILNKVKGKSFKSGKCFKSSKNNICENLNKTNNCKPAYKEFLATNHEELEPTAISKEGKDSSLKFGLSDDGSVQAAFVSSDASIEKFLDLTSFSETPIPIFCCGGT